MEQPMPQVIASTGKVAAGHSNRRSDEEGIETSRSCPAGSRRKIPTADLMKKGLRPPDAVPATH